MTRAAQLLDIPFCPHSPSDKQARFLLDFKLEALYGGAAGGGKSDGLLMGFLQMAHVPGYAGLILRRTFPDLNQPGALMDRAREWFGPTQARWSEQQHMWTFPSGAKMQFGYLEHEKQKFRYQSAEFQYIAFDELTQFSETQYRYLFTRLRRPQLKPSDTRVMRRRKRALSKVPLRMRGATNPGGEGHEWVQRRFIDSKDTNRSFHFATMFDNPYLDHESYQASLAQLDPVTRAQMERGDWGVKAVGNMFKRNFFMHRLLDSSEQAPSTPTATIRYWDLASTELNPNKPSHDPDWTSSCKMSRLRNGLVLIHDVHRFRRNPAETEDAIRQVANMDGDDIPVWFEQEPGASGKITVSHYSRNVLSGFTVLGRPSNRDKLSMAKPWSARASRGEVYLVQGPWLTGFFDEAESFPSGGHDDMIDSVSGAYDVLFRRGSATVRSPKGKVRGPEAPQARTMPQTKRTLTRR